MACVHCKDSCLSAENRVSYDWSSYVTCNLKSPASGPSASLVAGSVCACEDVVQFSWQLSGLCILLLCLLFFSARRWESQSLAIWQSNDFAGYNFVHSVFFGVRISGAILCDRTFLSWPTVASLSFRSLTFYRSFLSGFSPLFHSLLKLLIA